MGVTRYLESQVMERLANEHGFDNLRLYYEPYISLLSADGARLTDLARTLGVSRQAANQTANQIEAAGYIERAPDPGDGRAKRIILTSRGAELLRVGLVVAARLELEFTRIAGPDLSQDSIAALARFCEEKAIMPPEDGLAQRNRVSLVSLLAPLQ